MPVFRFSLPACCLLATAAFAQEQAPAGAMVPLGSGSGPTAGLGAAMDWGVNCAIRPLRVIEVAAPVNGIIAEVHVRPGQKVRAGDPLVSFDTDIAKIDLAMAEVRAADTSAIEIAERRLQGLNLRAERMTKARESNAVSEADYDAAILERDLAAGELAAAKADLAEAQIEAERNRTALDKAVVRSTVDGTVGEGLIDPGETPSANQPIATITETDPLRIEAYVPTQALAEFIARPSHKAAIAGTLYDVEMDYVSAVADLSSDTVSVFFTLRAAEIIPGLDCSIPPLTQ